MDGVELDGVEPVRGCLSIVVLGASGDLAKKMTFPALFNLYQQGFLHSDEVRIFGYARTRNLDDEFRYRLHRFLDHDKVVSPAQTEDVSEFLHLVKYISGSYDAEEDFRSLDKEINEHKSSKVQQDGSSRRLFYLALPPSVYPSAYKMIKLFCMNKSKYGGWTRIVIEKPFGKGFGLLEKLSNQIGELLHEKQLYRIDNYLGKELVQNLLHCRWYFVLQIASFCHFGTETILITSRLCSRRILELKGVQDILMNSESYVISFKIIFCRFFVKLLWRNQFLSILSI